MNYGDMKSQFVGLMNNKLLTADTALQDTFMQQAITRIQRKLRVPAMEAAVVSTWGGGNVDGQLALPNDYIELRDLTHTGPCGPRVLVQGPLGQVLWLIQNYAGTRPRVFCRQGSNWLIGPAPANGDTVEIDYYKEFPVLAVSTDTNWLSDIAPDVIIYGALSYAADFYVDNRRDGFEQRFVQMAQEVQDQADMDELSSDAAVQPSMYFHDGLNDNG